MLRKIFDIIIIILTIPLLGPLILIIYLTSLFLLGKPIFFLQKRSGLKGKQIIIFKFRTMKYFNQKEKSISNYGLFLRKTKLDELPQIFNVIRGDLTLIGPRPLYLEYNKLYSKKHKLRLMIKPGITGWAQINGRDDISLEKKVQLEQEYLYNRSTLFDIEIIIRTFSNVLFSKGVSH